MRHGLSSFSRVVVGDIPDAVLRESALHAFGNATPGVFKLMAVGVERHPRVRMPHAFAERERSFSLRNEQRVPGMSQTMKAHPRQIGGDEGSPVLAPD